MADNLCVEITVGEQAFSFELQHKQAQFGESAFLQWWMPNNTLYPTRNRKAANYRPIIDSWWLACCQHGTDQERTIREAYLLAQLLPLIRSIGSSRVVADSVLGKRDSDQRIADLERLLRESTEVRSTLSFRDAVADALGPPRYDDVARENYQEAVHELLDEGCRLLRSGLTDEAVAAVEHRWNEWYRRGRRGGHQEWKHLLNVFSYESRAAFHQCYSAVWSWLISSGIDQFQFTAESIRFHSLWHLEHRYPSDGATPDDVHLFSGHIFALHPAASLFIQTSRGKELIGNYLGASDSDLVTAENDLLGGMLVAVYHYCLALSDESQRRKRQPLRVGGSTQQVEEIQEDRKLGKLRREFPDNS